VSNRLTRGIRPIIATLAALAAAALLAPTAATATPDTPGDQPSIASVQKRLGELALQNSQLVEKYDQAKQDVTDKQLAATKAAALARRAAAAFDAGRDRLAKTVAAQYESGSFSATGALLESRSNENYLEQLATLRMLADHTSAVVKGLDTAEQNARSAQGKAATLLASAKAKRAELAKQKKHVGAQITKYKDLLERLNAAQRRAFERAQSPQVSKTVVEQIKSTPVVHASSAAAEKAVKFALAQVGKPYVWGAAGPGSYDCSGLTMSAWATAGVSLPHSAARQYNYGTHVSFNELQPGDLLFFYQPIGHVTIYIGDGMMVSAPQTGQDVEVIPAKAFGSDFTGATRLVN
jgi:cell wall-associated NlpC family hydrolase